MSGSPKNVESSDDSESLVACKSCDKSFDSDMEFIIHEIEIYPISSWSEEADTEQEKDNNVANNGRQISCTSVTNEDLEKKVFADLDRKIVLKPKVKLIVD